MLGCVCVCVRAPFVSRHPWLGCAVWVSVLQLGSRLRPSTAGWGVGVCVCLFARSACTLPLLAGVCGVGMCAWALVFAAPQHNWLGCWGVCVFVCALRLYPATLGWGVRCECVDSGSCFGCAPPRLAGVLGCVCVCVHGLGVARHLFLCRGLLRAVRAARICCIWWPLLLGTCPCALVVAATSPLWRACWPRVGAPRLVRSGLSWCSGWLSQRHVPFPQRGTCALDLLGGCAGHVEARREPGSLCLPLAAAEAAVVGLLPVVPVQGPATGLSLAGPSGVRLGLCALRWLHVWTRSLTRPVSPTVRLSTRNSAGAGSAVLCGRRHRPFHVEARLARVPCVWACACFLGRVGRTSLLGAFWCASPLPVAVLAALFVRSAPSGAGVALLVVVAAFWFVFFFVVRPPCLWCSVCWGMCVFVCALRLYPATLGWGLRCGYVCLGSGFGCAPAHLAGVLGCVCVCVRASSAGLGGPASRARFGAPHPFLWPFLLLSLSAQPPPGRELPCLWLLLRFGLSFFLLCAPLVSGVPCFPALSALGRGVLWSPPPLFFCIPLLFPFFFPPRRPSVVFFLSVFFVFSLFELFFFFLLPFSFFFAVLWRAGYAVLGWCVLGCGACWCVLLWALCSGAGRCALALCRSVVPT